MKTGLHPVIDRVLSLGAPDEAAFPAEVLREALASMPEDPQDPAWRASRLGQRGFPLELAFRDSREKRALRFTTEVERPDRSPSGRLKKALALAGSLGCEAWPSDVIEDLKRLHRDCSETLTFGAWLGVRQREARSGKRLASKGPFADPPAVDRRGGERAANRGALESSFKIYAELPSRGAEAFVESLESAWGFRTWGGARPILLGVEPGRLELYYQALAPRRHELPVIFERAGFARERATPLLSRLERVYGLKLERGLPAPEVGWSYAWSKEEGQEPQVGDLTLYHMADAVLGRDRSIRRRWLELLAERGRSSALYESLSRPFESRVSGDLHHGLFGIGVPRRGELSLALGLTPPADHAGR